MVGRDDDRTFPAKLIERGQVDAHQPAGPQQREEPAEMRAGHPSAERYADAGRKQRMQYRAEQGNQGTTDAEVQVAEIENEIFVEQPRLAAQEPQPGARGSGGRGSLRPPRQLTGLVRLLPGLLE